MKRSRDASDPRMLNGLILSAPDTPALLALVSEHGASFSDVNAATALLRVSKASPPPSLVSLEPLSLVSASAFTAVCFRGGSATSRDAAPAWRTGD